MNWILIPSLCAFLIKLVVLKQTHSESWAGHKWTSLILVLVALNLTEMIAYSGYLSDLVAQTHMVKAYYVCSLATMAFCLLYVADDSSFQDLGSKAILSLAGMISAVILLSDKIIGDFIIGSMPIVAEKGEWFSVFSSFAMFSSLMLFSTLGYNYSQSANPAKKAAYAYTIIAMIPLALVSTLVLTLQSMGISANGSMFLPMATTAFLIITAKGKDSSQIERDPRLGVGGDRDQARARGS